MFEEYTDELAGSVTASYSGPADAKKKKKKKSKLSYFHHRADN